MLVTQLCLTLCGPMDCSPPGSSAHGLLQQESWSRLPFPSPGDLPHPGLNPGLLYCRPILYCLSHQGSPVKSITCLILSLHVWWNFFCKLQKKMLSFHFKLILVGRGFKRKGIYVYLSLIHAEVWQKTAKFCKAIILQLKINKFLKDE